MLRDVDHRVLCLWAETLGLETAFHHEASMKIKIFAAILLSALVCLAQTSNQTNPSAGKTQSSEAQVQSGTKAICPCCKTMAESKDAKPCCQHDSATKDSKETMSCCSGKDGMSCMKDDTARSNAAGTCCGGSDQKGCCAKSDKNSEQTAMACCGGSGGGHCGMQHHDHGNLNK
jgi:hypothetical protein